MTVDLNRLRQAREFDMTDRVQIESEAADAVLDAPTVWFCASAHRIGCSGPKDTSIPMREAHADCGLVNLVPVKRTNHAT